MKVGFLLLNPVSAPFGFSMRPRMLMLHLARLGVEVHLFSAFAPDPKLGDGIHQHRLSVPPIPPAFSAMMYRITRAAFKSKLLFNHCMARDGTLNRIVRNLAAGLRPLLRQYPCDILQGEQDLAGAALLEARPSADVPVVTDLLDLWADEECMAGRIRDGGPAFRAMQGVTQYVLQESDLVLVGNEEVSAYVVKMHGINPVKIRISNNGGELREERRNRTDDIPRVIYAGNLESYSHADLFAKCLPFLKQLVPDVEPLIVGDGPEGKTIRKLLGEAGSDFSRCLRKPIDREEMLQLFTNSDVGIITTLKPYATPLKFFEYLSVGLPVVAFKGFWWSRLIEQHGLGLTAEREPEQLAQTIAEMFASSHLDRWSTEAKRFIKTQGSWLEVARSLVEAYEKLPDRVTR